RTQANYIEDDRVVAKAMQSPEWKALGRGIDTDAQDKFHKSLEVITDPRESEWIRVKFQDTDPVAAKAAVEQVLAAYQALYAKYEMLIDPATIEDLQGKQRTLTGQISDLKRSVNDILSQIDAADIDLLQKSQLEELARLDKECALLDSQI